MEVSPITLVWSMGAAVCLTLGGIHLLVGIGRKEGRGTHLLFAATAFSVVGVILAELLAFKAVTLEALVSAFKVSGGFQFLAWLGMVWFVVYYCRLTNLWGACLASAAFAFAAVVHLMSPYGITHDEIASFSLYGLPWGEQIALPAGSRNVWWLLSLCGILVLMFFLGGAVARVVRRGDWNKATRLAVASTVFLLAYLHTLFVDYGLLTSPRFLGVAFVGFLLIVGSDLGGEIIRTLSSGVASNERRWRTLFEEVQFSVLGINVRGQIAYANPHLASRMGIDVEDLLGRDVVEILDEEIAEGFDLRLEYAFREGPSPSAQLTMRTGSGAKREFTWSFVRLVSQDGMVEGLLAIGADMTDHARPGARRKRRSGRRRGFASNSCNSRSSRRRRPSCRPSWKRLAPSNRLQSPSLFPWSTGQPLPRRRGIPSTCRSGRLRSVISNASSMPVTVKSPGKAGRRRSLASTRAPCARA